MDQAIRQLIEAVDLIAPELILVVTVCVMFVTGPFFVSEAGVAPTGLRKRWAALSLVAIGCAWFVWFTGAPTHPVWVYNLRANPAVELRDHTTAQSMRVREVEDETERERLWDLAVAACPPYAEYQARTTRRIPLFVAEPER